MDMIHDIVVVGSGFAGIGMGVRLRELGFHDFVILEQAERVGGTWRDNHYPGAACDVQSLVYSFSFEPNPRWSRMFAEQPEILAYLEHVTDKYGLRPHLRFGCAVQRASWRQRHGVWKLELADGRSVTARVVIAGTGGLSRPMLPQIPGRERFRGAGFHTAAWDHGFDLTGKTVAVIGTGASAIQVVPAIAPKLKKLHVFQRTPPWIMAKSDRAISPAEQRMFAALPLTQKAAREAMYWRLESRVYAFVVRPELMEYAKKEALAYLAREVPDPRLRAKLTPSYSVGCKRVLLSNDYFAALQRDNVELVTDAIAEIRPHSIATRDGRERAVDAIVYATGFSVGDFTRAPFEIRGRGGRDLMDEWNEHGVEAYLGTAIAGFPNLFIITGPNTGLGHNSMVLMIEAHVQYIADCLLQMKANRLAAVEVKREVQTRYNARLQRRMERTIWQTGGCKSWYQTSSGKNVALWPGSTASFKKRTAQFDLASYEATPASALESATSASEPVRKLASP